MNRSCWIRTALCWLVGSLSAASAHAVDLPRVFSDGMVLQRDRPIQVWGRAAAGARIQVALGADRASATAGADGGWRVELPARAAGGPFTMRIDDGTAPRELRDVLVGDVWLASGQSNMEWPISQSADADVEIARATDPLIRHFKIPKSWSGTPQWQLAGGEWIASSPAVAGQFSAVAHFFARELRRSEGVPIGIIDSTWGGSSIEAWMDAATQGIDGEAQAALAERLKADDERALAQARANLARWQLPADDRRWNAADLDAAGWADIAVPGLWEGGGFNGMDGIAWYRTTFELSAAEAGRGLALGVGRIDDTDTTWVNGVEVGTTESQYNLARVYEVPASALRAGTNTIAVRVTDLGGGGGIHGPEEELFVQPGGGARRPLAGTWAFRPAQVTTLALDDDKNQRPTLLYNAMIHPLQPLPVRGVIWYQGEANAGSVEQAMAYRQQFPALIRQWRTQFDAPALPFLWVQLASWHSGGDEGDTSPWAALRESQTATLSLPATGQAVAIDIGDVGDIHPKNKQDVGKRLALAARRVAYGEALIHRGPVFEGARFADGVALLSFDADGLAARGGDALQGFRLAGADRRFHPAAASIDADRVVVRSDAVAAPVAVRYAWSDAPVDANLVGASGLPASPFRSDDW
ncbi:9-O-acetylesterase [Luteimonas viscosa]|uniref:9-O-acetylesterase n=1 Tax=Luteimonas viscosa TaxID=1132694 RepID=A0A5D4XS21_9GAMM|nr:sialate O-acetylesterase [Luteimonas viscosa]TYT26874.1 9-O-acetylesterase [Luteimonas viscosa]